MLGMMSGKGGNAQPQQIQGQPQGGGLSGLAGLFRQSGGGGGQTGAPVQLPQIMAPPRPNIQMPQGRPMPRPSMDYQPNPRALTKEAQMIAKMQAYKANPTPELVTANLRGHGGRR